LCRCGSYPRVIKAIERASQAMTAAHEESAPGEALLAEDEAEAAR
jgi:hypothetical protein